MQDAVNITDNIVKKDGALCWQYHEQYRQEGQYITLVIS